MKISSFLNKDNEDEFRNIESNVIDEVSKQNNIIISCGGGVIKKQQNIDYLRRNLFCLLELKYIFYQF